MKKFLIGILLFLSAICCAVAAGCSHAPRILDAPTNLRVENNVLRWDEVENARGYSLYMTELNRETEIKNNYYDFSSLNDKLNADFSFEIELLAVGDGERYLDSDWVKYTCTLKKITEEVDPSQGLSYELTADGTGYSVKLNWELKSRDELYIPDEYNGLPVKEVAESPYYGNKYPAIKTIRFPSALEKINKQAFQKFTALESIVFSASLKTIEKNAFADCTSLTGVNLPASLETIEWGAFAHCTSLTALGLPEGLKTVGGFLGCTALSFVRLPSTLKTIEKGAFNGCTALSYIEIPDGITEIGSFAFENCSALTGIKLPDSVTKIGDAAFQGCTALTGIELPDSVTKTGDTTFQGCTALTGIELPDGVSVGDSAFAGCTALTKIDCSKCSAVAGDAFSNCSALTEIIFPKDPHSFTAQAFCKTGWYENQPDGFVIVNGDTLLHYKGSVPNNGVIENFPAEIKYIVAFAFGPYSSSALAGLGGASDVVSIEIPDGVRLCGESIFDNCRQLKHVKLPKGITEIPDSTFSGCRALESVVIPEGVTKIEEYAFYFCKSLAEISFPSTLEEIETRAFSQCPLTKVCFSENLKTLGGLALDGNFAEVILPKTVNMIRPFLFNEETVIYYRGTEADKNEYFADVTYKGTWYYYIENEADLPADGGNYWHFAPDGKTPVIWQTSGE